MRQRATVLFSDLLIGAIDTLLVPIVYAYVAVCCPRGGGERGAEKLASVLKMGGHASLLTAVLLAFVGYLTASGAIAGSADAAAIKTAKMAISRAVPVVGGILADAAETVLVGAGVLRGTVGIVGMLGVLAICLTPSFSWHFTTSPISWRRR
ncbi:MAG: stage III sporulation protein AE [Oscillospiraceae bacterium]